MLCLLAEEFINFLGMQHCFPLVHIYVHICFPYKDICPVGLVPHIMNSSYFNWFLKTQSPKTVIFW